MLTLDDLNKMKQRFGSIAFSEKRPHVFKALVPFFHEDGDMYDIFVEESICDSSKIRVSDYGLTIMKLSYTFDLDSEHKFEVLSNIIAQNRCFFDDGNIYIDVFPDQLECAIYQMAQVISKVSNMEIIGRETLKSLFYDFLDAFICEELSKKYSINKKISPGNDKDCIVDYEIAVVISCLNFMQEQLPFRSLVIHEDFEKLSAFNQKQITNVSDKQFTSFDDFKSKGSIYIDRELSA